MSDDANNPPPEHVLRRPIFAAAMRGARFGGMIAGGLMLIVGCVGPGLCVFKIVPAPPVTLKDLGGTLAAVGISAVYGAIAGAAIMGTMAAVRSRGRC